MKYCKHVNPQGRLCRNEAEFDFKNLDFCINHISGVQEDEREFDRALICLKHRTRQEAIAEARNGATLTSFINFVTREEFDVIRSEIVAHSGEATTTSYKWNDLVNIWKARFNHKKQ